MSRNRSSLTYSGRGIPPGCARGAAPELKVRAADAGRTLSATFWLNSTFDGSDPRDEMLTRLHNRKRDVENGGRGSRPRGARIRAIAVDASALEFLLQTLLGTRVEAHLSRNRELAPRYVWRDIIDHFYFRIRPASSSGRYGVLQYKSCALVIFVAAPMMLLSVLTMAPTVTAAFPVLLDIFGGDSPATRSISSRSCRLALLLCVQVVMVIASGWKADCGRAGGE